MKTAVIITGQARTFAHCWKTQREAVFRKLDDPTFFVSVVDDAEGRAMHDTLNAAYPGKVYFELPQQPAMPEEQRERFEAESFHAPWFRSVPVEAIWKQFWHLARGWEFAIQHSRNIEEFERFVRIRPDLHFHNWTHPEANRISPTNRVYSPWWGSWGGCPDRFAYIAGYEAAQQYFNVFYRINELLAEGCAYHPETMLARALERAGVNVYQTMDAEFMTVRVKGDSRPHDKASYSNRDILNYINARLGTGDR